MIFAKMNKLQNSTLMMPVSGKDKAKDWQLEILMEKLRSKASQVKSLPEISKNVRMTLLEKRYNLDSVEKQQHQKCLDSLQHVIKVTGLQSMIERLESLTRQLGLRFVVEPSGVFIFSDMFYLEILLESSGAVKDVKIHHEGKTEEQSCSELANCLTRGDFSDFTTQLEGFVSIYQLNAEKKVKSKAFSALEALEADLYTLSQLQYAKEVFNLIHKSPVGVLEKRRGGHSMKLTYFVSPYDMINVEKHDMEGMSVEGVVGKGLGQWVTVTMEGSAGHKLQTGSLITVSRGLNGKSTSTFIPLTSQNSAMVPACFLLKLNKPLPMCFSLVRRIQQIQQWTEPDNNSPQPLLNMIVNHVSEGKLSCCNNKGLFVTLPDQTHCYCMTENRNMNGVFVNSIPFTHPAHVQNILMILREQALFNTIISSCVRPNSRQSFDNMTMFEVSALSSTQISISLEHPLEECMATADIDLSDISNLVCKIQNPGTPPPANAPDVVSELATKVLNKTFSIPVTLRAVIKMWERQAAQPLNTLFLSNTGGGSGQSENFSLPLGSVDPGGHLKSSGAASGLAEFGGLHHDIKQEQPSHQWNESMLNSNFQSIPPSVEQLSNIELANILSAASAPVDKSGGAGGASVSSGARQRRHKRKVGAPDDSDLLMDASSCDSTSRSTPISQETEIATPNSGSQSDLELSNVDSSDLSTMDKSETVDMEEILSSVANPLRKTPPHPSPSSSSSIVSDFSDKSLVPANVSITPISSFPSPTYSSDKRLEVIPLPYQSPNLPTSITITPIPTKPDEKKDKKSSRTNREDREKKRKRKRDESPMGPPEKVPAKDLSTPTSPNMMRKFSTSPILMKKSSNPGSPKHGTSGKPSMSTLKSAASSPKSGGDKKRDGSREKDKSRAFASSKAKSASAQSVKKTDGGMKDGSGGESSSQDSLPSPNADSKTNPNTLRNRKGSLSAIVDKLNFKVNAQQTDIPTDLSKTKPPSKDGKITTKNSEYMVKTSSDGLKLTINKPKKENKGGSSAANSLSTSNKVAQPSGSPKVHTGLKPGVNSGPASKKPQQLQKSAAPNSYSPNKPKPSTSSKPPSTSGLPKSINKPTTSPKLSSSATDLSRNKLKPKEKSIFSSLKERGKGSPTDDIYKLPPKGDPYASALMMEGMMKTLDKNFQIPKLSDKKKNELNNVNRSTVDTKIFDIGDIKYPLSIPAMNPLDQKIRNNMSMLKGDELDDKKKEGPQNLSGSTN